MRREPVAVVGLGLVGGSIARGLSGAGYRVFGHDRPPVLRQARRAGAVEGRASLDDAVAEAGIVILAGPPRANLSLLPRVARAARKDAVLTDVTSVKGPICRLAARARILRFVGGHPLAGSEGSGFGAGRADLFSGKAWVLSPLGRDPEPTRRVAAMVRALGARPVILSAEEHDRAVAFLSHLPQLVAWALLRTARGDPGARRALHLSGPGFKDMTRLASSPRGLWKDILDGNREEVDRALAAFRRALRPTP
jgi:prephenate dehydrogenase